MSSANDELGLAVDSTPPTGDSPTGHQHRPAYDVVQTRLAASLRMSLETASAIVSAAALRLTRSVEDAKDIVQDVFYNLTKKILIGPLDILPGREVAYLKKATNNAFISWLRKKTAISRGGHETDLVIGSDILEESLPCGYFTDPADSAVHSSALATLRAAIERLPEGQQELIRLRMWHGLTLEAIGHRVGKSEKRVRVQLALAFAALREDLLEGGWEATQ